MQQQRLPKFERTPDAFTTRQITPRSLVLIDTIARYRFIPTSLILYLVAGNHIVTARHLQQLYHKGLVNRFPRRREGRPGEFVYYLDNRQALELLVDHLAVAPESLPWEEVRNNREKSYAKIMRSDEAEGHLMFLRHELMISRFHAMLELACRHSEGKVELKAWRQGTELHDRIEVPKLKFDSRQGMLFEAEEREILPHRPDAFFTLLFPQSREGERHSHFFYEADRKTTSTNKFIKKLRAHFHFVVRQQRQREKYQVRRIRAVLTETLDTGWAEQLRQAARHPSVSGEKATPLFWFSAAEIFTKEHEIQDGSRARKVPRFLVQPDLVFQKVWATPLTRDSQELVSLLD